MDTPQKARNVLLEACGMARQLFEGADTFEERMAATELMVRIAQQLAQLKPVAVASPQPPPTICVQLEDAHDALMSQGLSYTKVVIVPGTWRRATRQGNEGTCVRVIASGPESIELKDVGEMHGRPIMTHPDVRDGQARFANTERLLAGRGGVAPETPQRPGGAAHRPREAERTP